MFRHTVLVLALCGAFIATEVLASEKNGIREQLLQGKSVVVRLRNMKTTEYLYCAADDLAADSQRRRVLTWRQLGDIPENPNNGWGYHEEMWTLVPVVNNSSSNSSSAAPDGETLQQTKLVIRLESFRYPKESVYVANGMYVEEDFQPDDVDKLKLRRRLVFTWREVDNALDLLDQMAEWELEAEDTSTSTVLNSGEHFRFRSIRYDADYLISGKDRELFDSVDRRHVFTMSSDMINQEGRRDESIWNAYMVQLPCQPGEICPALSSV